MTPEHKEKLKVAREAARAAKNGGMSAIQKAAGKGVVSTDDEDEKSSNPHMGALTPLGESLDTKMDSVIQGLNTVSAALMKLVEMQSAPREIVDTSPKSTTSFTPKLEDETYPQNYMPANYRRLVDQILSSEFGAKVTDFPDRTDFWFELIVPDKFSSVSKEDRDRGVKDERGRMIPRALGENGVKEWCQIVRKNLNKYYSAEGKSSPFQSASE